MTDWTNYLADKEHTPVKNKKKRGPGCKRNKINKDRYGPCAFNSQDECMYCKRPRRKTLRLDPTTNTITIEYYE